MEYEDIESPQPSTSRGNPQTMEAIKTTQNPYYCDDSVQLEENVSGNTKNSFQYFTWNYNIIALIN